MKLIAFYLPQFHEIEENNQWWGKGFTEWHNVKKAKPLFKGHNQPRVPLNKNYYDLSETNSLEQQQRLLEKYNIYGLCFYHYWFKDGKKLLEKPAELLLQNANINMNFCFSWANEPWTRTWDGKSGEIIMPQEYGAEKEWQAHFEYLLPFFKDKRYIKVEGKPVFLLYKSSDIPQLEKKLAFWQLLAKKNGLPGVYLINTLRTKDDISKVQSFNQDTFSAHVEFEPRYSLLNAPKMYKLKKYSYKRTRKTLDKFIKIKKPINLADNYDKIVQLSLSKKKLENVNTIPGAFVEWDNTPRVGKNGSYIKGFTIEKFKEYMNLKIEKGITEYKSPFLFINAWNEWAEGTYLEPDEKYGYSKLEILKELSEKMDKKYNT